MAKTPLKKKIFSLLIICFLGVVFYNCNFEPFETNHAPVIDSLNVLELFDEYKNGDTLKIICFASDSNNDSLTYNWYNDSGYLISSQNQAILIPYHNHLIINVRCEVSDTDGNITKDSITIDLSIDFSNYNNYFPIAIGNKWEYEVGAYGSEYQYNGREIWEIIQYDEMNDTLYLSCDFNGTFIGYGHDSNYVYPREFHDVAKLVRRVKWDEFSNEYFYFWTSTGGISAIGASIFYTGVPFLFESDEDTVAIREKPQSHFAYTSYWVLKKDVGLIEGGVYGDHSKEVKLLSYHINP